MLIDSPGGLICQADAISVALRTYRGATIGEVAGRAHSAAAEVIFACDHRIIRRGATIMFHRCSCLPDGLAAEEDYRTIALVSRLTRNPLPTVRDWFNKGVYFDADQALRYGLVDSICSTPPLVSVDLVKKPRP